MQHEQKITLRRKAHALKPVVIIGHQGLTDAVHAAIEEALVAHELIKIRFHASDANARNSMIEKICTHHQAELISKIGHVVVVWRENTNLI